MRNRGHLIVLEGPDGVGKSTLTAALLKRLGDLGLASHLYAFPGNESGTFGSLVYRLHHKDPTLGIGEIAPIALQAAHIAAHLDAIERVFRPKLESGENIVLDRYWWSTEVYGALSGVPHDVLERLIAAERCCWGALQPLVIFLIDRNHPWRKSEDTPTWHQLAREYRELANREQAHSHVAVINNSLDPDEVVMRMANSVVDLIRTSDWATLGTRGNGNPQLGLALSGGVSEHPPAPIVFVGRAKSMKGTKVFDTYWRFAAERQEVFFRRLDGAPPAWSTDSIIQRHRFTNAYRASDRVSQYLIRRVQYAGEQGVTELFFRTILFKLFNRIETWELLERSLGGIRAAEFEPARFEKVLDGAQKANERIYSAAYIMPCAPGGQGYPKHAGHLRLLEMMLRAEVPQRLADARSLRHGFDILRAYPMMGDFLAFQYLIDLNYSRLMNFSEMDFVVPGPGARRGIAKCFSDVAGLSEADVIRKMAEIQSEEFERRGLAFRDLWGRPLQLIDCQNLFCEVDKYARVAHPDLNSESGPTRIKQVFRPAGMPAMPWYPPKWRLNEKISHKRGNSHAPD